MSLYAINGKEPIAAWIPSRDDVGNGTTTLTDLVGSNNGTLTNMDAATDWVSDTDAGGVRALDFDGSNDLVTIPFLMQPTYSISLWAKAKSLHTGTVFSVQDAGVPNLYIGFQAPHLYMYVNGGVSAFLQLNFTANTWYHVVLVMQGNGNPVLGYRNGVYSNVSANLSTFPTQTGCVMGRRGDSGAFLNGLVDDVRVFNQALDSTDVADLYTAQRGGITNPPIITSTGFTGIRGNRKASRRIG